MVRGKKRLNAYLRRIRRSSVRSRGDHRWSYPCKFACGLCGRRYVRLYRDYGMFLRVAELRCNVCIESTSFMVPCVTSPGGMVWGHCDGPAGDVDRWLVRPDADLSPGAPRWDRGEWVVERERMQEDPCL